MNDKQKRFLLVDILLIVMIVAPLAAAMLLKRLCWMNSHADLLT